MLITKSHAAALLMLCICVINAEASGQDVVAPRFWQINIPEIDEPANAAMNHMATGMSDIILALNKGRNAKVAIDKEIGTSALGEFKSAMTDLDAASMRIHERKINVEIIMASQYAKAYENLVVTLHQAGYVEPTSGKEFLEIIKDVTNHCVTDIGILLSNPQGAAGQQKMVQVFLDLIAQKALLEHLGSTSAIITIAMS